MHYNKDSTVIIKTTRRKKETTLKFSGSFINFCLIVLYYYFLKKYKIKNFFINF